MLLWFAIRGTGVVLLALLTLSTALGVLSTARAATTRWPRFATQVLHRNVALLTMSMLLAHVLTAIRHEFVDIRWYDALAPIGGTFTRQERLPMALAAVGFDILVVVTGTSLVRAELPHRFWRGLHLLTYLAWPAGLLHGLLIGTDADTRWSRTVTLSCVAVVGVAALLRLATWFGERRRDLAPARRRAVGAG
jgi:predicted ferric reductase